MLLSELIRSEGDHGSKLPKVARSAYYAIKEDKDTGDKLNVAVQEAADNINVHRLANAYGAVVGDFDVVGIPYTYSDIENMVTENQRIAKTRISETVTVLDRIMRVLAKDVTSLEEYAAGSKQTHQEPTDNIDVLARYVEFIEKQTYKGVWSDIMSYPWDNQKQGVKRHLMLGFASNTGKTIIVQAMRRLYNQVCVSMANRPRFEYDAGIWNAAVINSFLVLVDDDNAETPVSEDYIKNFLNRNMPLQLAAAGGKRWQKTYYGSSVIATNTEEEFYHDPANNKRIALVRLDEPLEGFTDDELDYLHNLPLGDIMHFVNTKQTSRLFGGNNNWDDSIEQVGKEIHAYMGLMKAAPKKTLIEMFGKKEVENALGKATTVSWHGTVFYGYKVDTDTITQTTSPNFDVALFRDLHETKPVMETTTFAEFAKAAESMGSAPKHAQPLFALFHGKSAKEEDITEATGVVIDVDKSRLNSLEEIELDYDYIAYETSSSEPGALRYRIVIPGIISETKAQYIANLDKIATELPDKVDLASATLAHRYFIGAKRVIVHRRAYEEYTALSDDGILSTVRDAQEGERNSITFWACNRAKEDGNFALMEKIIEVSPCSEAEKARFRKRFE